MSSKVPDMDCREGIMKKISTVKKDRFEFSDLPVEAKDGTFRSILECKKCGEMAYATTKWDGRDLKLVARSHGESQHTRISDECMCQDSDPDDMEFVEFELTDEHKREVEFPRNMLLLAALGVAAQAVAAFGRFDGGPNIFMGMIMFSAIMFGMVRFMFGPHTREPENRPRYYFGTVAAAWAPAIFMFMAPT